MIPYLLYAALGQDIDHSNKIEARPCDTPLHTLISMLITWLLSLACLSSPWLHLAPTDLKVCGTSPGFSAPR